MHWRSYTVNWGWKLASFLGAVVIWFGIRYFSLKNPQGLIHFSPTSGASLGIPINRMEIGPVEVTRLEQLEGELVRVVSDPKKVHLVVEREGNSDLEAPLEEFRVFFDVTRLGFSREGWVYLEAIAPSGFSVVAIKPPKVRVNILGEDGAD